MINLIYLIKFNFRTENEGHNVPKSNVVDIESFNKIKENQLTQPTSQQDTNTKLARKNLFISKPFKDINSDMKDAPLIRNPAY